MPLPSEACPVSAVLYEIGRLASHIGEPEALTNDVGHEWLEEQGMLTGEQLNDSGYELLSTLGRCIDEARSSDVPVDNYGSFSK